MIIIVAGPSGVGKTTLAKKIGRKFQLPVIHKDEIKEILFDTLDYKKSKKSKVIGIASWKLFYHFAEKQISNGMSVILEANFKPNFAEEKFKDFQRKYNVNIIQIRCIADSEIIIQRFRRREKVGRHPGHQDHLLCDETLKKGIIQENVPLKINASLVEVNMDDFKLMSHEEIFVKIKKLM